MADANPTLPHTLYRYFDYAGARATLETRKLRFSSPFRFNDPFDGQWDPGWVTGSDEFLVPFRAACRRLWTGEDEIPAGFSEESRKQAKAILDHLASLSEAERLAKIESELDEICRQFRDPARTIPTRQVKMLNKLRVLSLAESRDSLLMWSHYGDHHTGVVLGLDANILSTNWKIPCKAVRYCEELPRPISQQQWLESLMGGKRTYDHVEIRDAVTLAKAKCWEYEREWRFVFRDDDTPDDLTADVKFPLEALKSVTFGCASAALARLPLHVFLRREYPTAEIAVMRQSRTGFRVEMTTRRTRAQSH